MNQRTILYIVVAAIVLVALAYMLGVIGGSPSPTTTAPPPATTAPATPAPATPAPTTPAPGTGTTQQ
jgi:hypothetical protein